MTSITSSKLVHNLAKLSRKEKARFLDFVNSPFFNTHQPTRRLAHLLLVEFEDWQQLTKSKLSHLLFPDRPEDEPAVSNVMSYLMKLLEKFLTQLGLEVSDQQDIYLLQAAHYRQMTKLVDSTFKKAISPKNRLAKRGAQQLLREYQLNNLRHNTFRWEDRFKADESLSRALRSLENWWLVEKLDKAGELMALSGAGKDKLTPTPEILELTKLDLPEEEPLALLFQKCLLTMTDPQEEAHYFDLRSLLKTHEDSLPVTDQKRIHRHLLNYCAKRVNRNELKYRKEMFAIYQELAASKLILERGYIQQITYNNITSLACLLGSLEWADNFVEEYQQHLLPEGAKSAYSFNLAKVRFFEKRFDEALLLFGKVRFINPFYQLNCRVFQLKIYYENGEQRLLESNLENLRLYLMRSRQATSFSKLGKRFVVLLKMLIQLKEEQLSLPPKVFQQRLEKLKENITSKPSALMDKDWLLKRVDEARTQVPHNG
ncbi:hypothetical protein [Neolewinella persica]|uniref:hypothetical protein n=1 Tax=Neolewinella persica TaxID=70998 RepID=UPI00036D198F|nr:hypothetical protein [Neolewinella persica]